MPEPTTELTTASTADNVRLTAEALMTWLADYPWAQSSLAAMVVLLIAWLAHAIAKRCVLGVIRRITQRLPNWWGGVLQEQRVLQALVPVIPLAIIYRGASFIPHLPGSMELFVQRLAMAVMILVIGLALGGFLTTINEIYSRYPIARGRPIKGYLQVVKIVAYIAAGILILATLMDQSPVYFLSGLGAMTAILLLIFRDTLLSLVAGIQLVNNDLVRVGDWIEMPQFNADGDVVDISLHVVKVQNWDRTVTIIPTHKFLEHSFKNWRAMHESGGRQIKRSINIDMSTIRFLKAEEIQRFERFMLLRDYIRAKVSEIEKHNRDHIPDELADIACNARHLTNVGTFRAYISAYLRQHPKIHREMTFLIRQLQPTEHGLPIQIYVYTNDTNWVTYEGIQADIFDHILAAAGEFGLRVFQEPSGHDLAQLGWTSSHRPQERNVAIDTADRN